MIWMNTAFSVPPLRSKWSLSTLGPHLVAVHGLFGVAWTAPRLAAMPTEPLPRALARVRELLLDESRLVRAIGSGRRRGTQPRWRRAELRYVDVKAGRRLQVTRYDDTQAHA